MQQKFEFRVVWGFIEKRPGRIHPNIDRAFNSAAVVESAKVQLRDVEDPGVLIQVAHREFKEGVSGTVLIYGRELAEELAEFISARKGKTVEEVAAEALASGAFNPVA